MVGVTNTRDRQTSVTVSPPHHHREPLDWSSSSYGLFIGLLGLVTSTVVLILYFALVNQNDFRFFAILANNISDLIINTMMIVAMVIGFFQIKNLELIDDSEGDYDAIMITTAFGILVYSTFNIIAGVLNGKSFEPGELVICNGLAELIEVTVQLLFIADLKHKRISREVGAKKHGRNIVTFLLITNLGLWITYNFEIQKVNATPDQMEFYGFLPWVVIQRLTLPLCVFFRFHSTVVFAELWKNCYRIKKPDNF